MSFDKFFEDLSGAVEGIRKLVGEAVEELFPQEGMDKPEKPLEPTPGYLPRLGDVVRVRNGRTGLVESGRVTKIYDGPGNLAVHTFSDQLVHSAWEKTELVSNIGFKPTPGYEPNLGDKVTVLDKKGNVHTGFVTQIHQNYRSAKVAIGDLDHVTDQVTQPWSYLELIERNERGEEPHEEPLAPQAKNRIESELDDSLSEQVPHQEKLKDEPVVAAYGTNQAFEDLKSYYEERLEAAENNAKAVSLLHQDFIAKVAEELGFKNPQGATSRQIIDFIRHINRHFNVVREVRARLNGILEDREDLLEP